MSRPATPRRRAFRGSSLVEVLVAGAIGLLVFSAVAPFVRLNRFLWESTLSDVDTQRAAQSAAHEMARQIRLARGVVTASSGSARLTLRLPRLDGAGRLVVPIADGDVVAYYVGNSQGGATESGGYLWRSVNGTPDRSWSVIQGRPRTPVAAGGLQFTYFPTADPESVIFRLVVSNGGTPPRTFTSSQEVVIRNRGL
jgi:hypothetical protein